jgi:hypothetical protein
VCSAATGSTPGLAANSGVRTRDARACRCSSVVLTPPHPFLPRCSEPGDYFTGMLGGRGFVVVLDEARQVRAYHNICSHRAAAVAVGEGRVPVCEAGAGGLRFECPCVPFATHTSRHVVCAAAMLPASCLLLALTP